MTTEFKAADVSVEDWIDGVSFLQADVTIYRDPALLAQYNPLIQRIETLYDELDELTAPEDDEDAPETSLSGDDAPLPGPSAAEERSMREKPVLAPRVAEIKDEITQLEKEAEALHAKFTANREVWTLRKMEEHEAEAIRTELGGIPSAPHKLAKNASKTMREKWTEAFDAFVKEMRAYTDEFNIRALATCVLKVDVNGEEKPAPSVAGLRKLATRPGGVEHIRELVGALEQLAAEGVSIVAPHRDRA